MADRLFDIDRVDILLEDVFKMMQDSGATVLEAYAVSESLRRHFRKVMEEGLEDKEMLDRLLDG